MAQIDDLLKKLEPSDVYLPGLDYETISDKFADEQEKKYPAYKLTKEEREEKRKELKESVKDKIDENITIIKTGFKHAKTNLDSINSTLKSFATTTSTPSVLGTVAPNPAWTILDTKQKIISIKAILSQISVVLVSLLLAAKTINYEIPKAIESVITLFATVSNAVALIPIK